MDRKYSIEKKQQERFSDEGKILTIPTIQKKNLPYTKKFQPQTLDDVIGHEIHVARFKVLAKDGLMLNFLLEGPSGIGKTSSVLCMLKIMLGNKYAEAVLELNASDDRGSIVVREVIEGFAKTQVTLLRGNKVVFLDEADSMTKGAQQALLKVIAKYPETRFVLSCNNLEKMIPGLRSHLIILHFFSLPPKIVTMYLRSLIQKEGIPCEGDETNDGVNALVSIAQGDLREAALTLQAVYMGYGTLSEKNVYALVDRPPIYLLTDIVFACHTRDLFQALTLFAEFYEVGHSSDHILKILFQVVAELVCLRDSKKKAFLLAVGETRQNIVEFRNHPTLQFDSLWATLSSIAD